MVELASLIAAGIGPTQARLFKAPLDHAFSTFEIATPVRQAAFVAQCAHESRHFTALEEGLFYRSPERICAIFRGSVPNLKVAQPLACNPKSLANHVYANRLGNGDVASGDGWRFRGRGLIQLTGRANYARAAAALGRPYVDQPDLVAAPEDSCLTAAWFWSESRLNALADALRIDAITRAINGPAMAGAKERRDLFTIALAAFAPATPTRGRRPAPPVLVPEPPEAAAAPSDAAGAPSRSGRAAIASRGGADVPALQATPIIELAWTVRGADWAAVEDSAPDDTAHDETSAARVPTPAPTSRPRPSAPLAATPRSLSSRRARGNSGAQPLLDESPAAPSSRSRSVPPKRRTGA